MAQFIARITDSKELIKDAITQQRAQQDNSIVLEMKHQGQLIELLRRLCTDLTEESATQVVARCKLEIGIPIRGDGDRVSQECTLCQRYLE